MGTEFAPSTDLQYYLSLTYPVQLSRLSEDGEEYWLAEILDLPGCLGDGETPDEAVASVEEAKRLWIEAHIEDGYEVPKPSEPHTYSGRVLLRMPKSLHQRLATEARHEGVSLNQFIGSVLAGDASLSEQIHELRLVSARANEASQMAVTALTMVQSLMLGYYPSPTSAVGSVPAGQETDIDNLTALGLGGSTAPALHHRSWLAESRVIAESDPERIGTGT